MSHTEQKSLRAPDPRPARTRAAIIEAVETLGAGSVELNVSSIVKEAGLSRSSFYSQFADVSDISVQMVRTLLDELDLPPNESVRDRTQRTLDCFLEEVEKHRDLYAALLGHSADSAAQKRIGDMLTAAALASQYDSDAAPANHAEPADNDKDNDNREFHAKFLVAGTLASAVDWITSERPVTLDVMKQRIRAITKNW